DGVHPCTPPFGFFPAMAAASEGNPVSQKPEQQPKHSRGNGNGNGNGNGQSIAQGCPRHTPIFAQQPQHP
ncbi:hypothetical protein PQU63_19255, partial [Xanthomonas protegens]